jgi:xeroderma pigmentosum group C-complementing protein
LYGFWQTKPYEPPIAENGRVPRNDFGNVELFQSCMLPIGCVHLRNMPILNRICRKLNIDCAAAVVGFDAHGGFSHAVYDGWIICEEFKEVVVAAFQEEERESAKRLIQKNQERILGNWANLVKMVLLREKLKKKYENKKSLIDNASNLNKIDAKKLVNLDDEIKVGAKLNRLKESKGEQEDGNESNKEEDEIEKPVILSKAKKRNRAKASTQTSKRKTRAKKKKVSPPTSEEEDEENNDDDEDYEDQEVDEYEEDYKPIKRPTRSKRVAANKKNKPAKSEKHNDNVEMDSIEEDECISKNGRPIMEIGKVISLPKKSEDDDVKLSESDDE